MANVYLFIYYIKVITANCRTIVITINIKLITKTFVLWVWSIPGSTTPGHYHFY